MLLKKLRITITQNFKVNSKLTKVVFHWLLLSFLLLYYFKLINSLLLFGDATMHANTTKDFIENGLMQTDFSFPPMYNFIQAFLFRIFGEPGLNFIVFLGVFIISVGVYLFSFELSNDLRVAFFSSLLVLASPKVVYYSSRMYMEVFLSGLFVFTFWMLIKYLKQRNLKNLLLLAILTAFSALTKQQGLFILFPSILLFLSISSLVKKEFSKIIFFVLIFTLFTLPGYYFVFKSQGKIIPGNEDYKLIALVNNAGRSLTRYEEENASTIDIYLQKKINSDWSQYLKRASILAESRHIWPLDPLTSWDSFKKANSLYVSDFFSSYINEQLANMISLTIIFGIALFLIKIKQSEKNYDKLIYKKEYLFFLLIFVLNNYFLFQRNNDQMRYHLFLPIVLVYFSSMFIIYLLNKFEKNNFRTTIKILFYVLFFLKATNSVQASVIKNSYWNKTQIYRPSKGGIYSVIEVGNWLKSNSNSEEKIWQSCGNELEYYSRRNVGGLKSIYFSDNQTIDNYLTQSNYKFLVIFDSQVVNDKEWKHFCWIPESFVDKINVLYDIVYISSYTDIKVYKVK